MNDLELEDATMEAAEDAEHETDQKDPREEAMKAEEDFLDPRWVVPGICTTNVHE